MKQKYQIRHKTGIDEVLKEQDQEGTRKQESKNT